eukprot:Seg207.3 transcript_id=Seg207.3/GoldUCD/mRNA.D3Y31 product="hypothetical protein" protein_id=Seg207.3/GoldUCD/D3Y31
MAEAANVSILSAMKNDNTDAFIENKTTLEDVDLEKNILAEIRRLKSKKKRADFIPISTGIERQHSLAGSTTHQHILHMILNGKIECSLAIPKGSQKQSILVEDNSLDNDPIANNDFKSREETDKTTKKRAANTLEPESIKNTAYDKGFPQATRFLETVTDLAKSLQTTNDILNLERENSRKFMEENFQLQIRLRDLEIFQARKQVSPTLKRHDAFLIDSLENKASETNTTKLVQATRAPNNSVHGGKNVETNRTNNANNANESNRVSFGTATTKHNENNGAKPKRNTQNHQQPRRGKENNRNKTSQSNRSVPNERSHNPIHICMVGDSQLRRMDADKMSNNHHEVVLNAKSGMKVEEAANLVDSEADVIIMHAGTNNLRDSTPEEFAEKVIKTFKKIKQKKSKAQLAYSSIFRRQGNAAANGMNVKVFQTNKILKKNLCYRV